MPLLQVLRITFTYILVLVGTSLQFCNFGFIRSRLSQFRVNFGYVARKVVN